MININDNRYLERVVLLYILVGIKKIYAILSLILLNGENVIVLIRSI